MEIITMILNQAKFFIINPFLYFGLILIYLQYRRQISVERKLFSSRIHSLSAAFFNSLGYGLIGGLFASLLISSIGVVFYPEDMWLIWVITGILTVIHVRFLCLSYSVGIVGVVAGMTQLYSEAIHQFINDYSFAWIDSVIVIIEKIHIPSLIAIVAILHLIEAILIRLQSHKQATPLFIESKRGKLVGGFQIQSFWFVPVFLIVSVNSSGLSMPFSFDWWPLIGSTAGGLSLIPVPIIIGYSDITTVYSPMEKSTKASKSLAIYSILLLSLAFIAEYWPVTQIVAALFAGIGHEIVIFIGKRKEKKLSAKYVHPVNGLKILEVIPESIADKIGIQTGETIKKVNGMAVKSREELYQALQLQSAFVKMEVINLQGQIKFAQHSIYTGEHHQLGIILAPDDKAQHYIEFNKINLLKLLKQRVDKVSKGA